MTVVELIRQTASDLAKSGELLEYRADRAKGTPDGIRIAKDAVTYFKTAALLQRFAGTAAARAAK